MTKRRSLRSRQDQSPSAAQAGGPTRGYVWLLLLCLTAIPHLPGLSNEFVNWDDDRYITNNQMIRGLDGPHLTHIATGFFNGNFHPLTMLSLAIDFRLAGLDPRLYHAENLVLHLINTCLLFWLFLLLGRGNRLVAFLAALIWAVHPLRVESVTWATSRKDLLYALFFFLACITYIRYVQVGRGYRSYGLTLVLFVLSCLSKGMAVVLPPLLLVIDYFFERRIDKRALLEKIPFFAISLGLGIVAVIAQRAQGAIGIGANLGPFDRIAVGVGGIAFYLQKTVMPWGLSLLYPCLDRVGDGLPAATYIRFALGLLGLMALAVWGRRNRTLLFAGLFYLVAIIPVLQFLPVGQAMAADRYSYLSTSPLYLAIGLLLFRVVADPSRPAWPKRAALAAVAAAGLMLGGLTWQRTQTWHDSVAMWTTFIETYPENAFGYYNRGCAYKILNHNDQAIANFNQALQKDPNYQDAHNNLGNILQFSGQLEKAVWHYTQAIGLGPPTGERYHNRGTAFEMAGQLDQALADYNKALSLSPGMRLTYLYRAHVLSRMQRFQEAVADYTHYLEQEPDNAAVLNERGFVYLTLGLNDLSMQDFEKAIALVPTYGEAYQNRGLLLSLLKNYPAAERDYTHAISLMPQNPEPLNNRGLLYEGLGQPVKAMADFDQALVVNPKYVPSIFNRGRLRLAVGRQDDAIADFTRVITIEPQHTQAYGERGRAYILKGQRDKAREDILKAEQLGGSFDPGLIKAIEGR